MGPISIQNLLTNIDSSPPSWLLESKFTTIQFKAEGFVSMEELQPSNIMTPQNLAGFFDPRLTAAQGFAILTATATYH